VNKVVARFVDGRLLKGSTSDFGAAKSSFHVALAEKSPQSSKPLLVQLKDLKALFFVKDLVGQPQYQPRQEFDPGKPVLGRKMRVTFNDGEILVGTTQGYQESRPGFFLIPADKDSNIERCFVVSAAVREISFI